MKQIFMRMLLAIAILVSATASQAAIIKSGTCGADGDNLTYTLTDDGILTISGTGEMLDFEGLYDSPFDYNEDIKSVVLDDGVASIGSHTFCNCYSLTTVSLPESLTSIGNRAFKDCLHLTTLTLPEGITSIGNRAFMGCESLTSLTLPEGITSIGEGTFMECFALTTLTLPEGITSIGDYAFSCCTSLTTLTFPEGITSIGDYAFYGCKSLTNLILPEGITSIGDYAFLLSCKNLSSITNLATTPQNINSNVFSDCPISTATLYVPAASLEAYQTADGWKDFGTILPIQTVIATGTCGADGDNLTYTLTEDGILTISGSGKMADWEDEKSPCFKNESIKSVTLSEGVTSIGNGAFSDCSSLASIELPSSLTSIGDWAFLGCSGLTSITFPSSLKNIGHAAFLYCTSLTSIELPSSLKSIGDDAFSECTSLTSIELPSSLTSIGDCAFGGCCSLTSIEIPASVNYIGTHAFECCSGLSSITVDDNNLVYDSRNNCNAIIETATNTLLTGCSSTVIPSSVTSIGDCAFSYCENLTSIGIPSSVTTIGDGAFYGCSSLTSIEIPSSVTSIGQDIFYACSGLSSITVDDNNPVYDSRNNCNAIIETATNTLLIGCSTTVISSSVTNIGTNAFSSCSNLTSIEIPSSVTSIEEYAFSNCYNLTEVYAMMESPITYNSFFPNCPLSTATLYVPVGSLEAYLSADGWKEFGTIIELKPEVEEPVDYLYASDANGRTATTVSIPINMKNSFNATGYEFSLVLPEAISPSAVTVKKSTVRKEDEMSFSKAVQDDGSIKVVCYATDGQPFSGNDGEVCTLTFTIPEDMEVGDYPIIVKNVEISENGTAHKIPGEFTSYLHIESYLLGDANMDGDVSVSDLSCIVNYLLNLDVPETFYVKAADANEDGDVSVSDLSTIVNLILYGNPNGANGAKARGERTVADCQITAVPFTITPGEEATLSLQLSSNQEVTAFQFDAILPDGLSCTKARRSTLVGEDHSFRSASLDDNLTRIVCYSGSNATFAANEGTIAELTIQADKDLLPGLYALNLQNAEVVSLDGSVKIDAQTITFEVVAPTGIEMIESEPETTTRYDFMGRAIAQPQGIFFENGKKILAK